MNASEIELRSDGIEKLLNSSGVAFKCLAEAQRMANKAGPHFTAKGPLSPGSRALALVVPKDGTGAYLEATEKTLSKAVSSCRL